MEAPQRNSFYTQDDITVLDGLEPLKSRWSPLQIDLPQEDANGVEALSPDCIDNANRNEGKATR